jgi:hypothetical protein
MTSWGSASKAAKPVNKAPFALASLHHNLSTTLRTHFVSIRLQFRIVPIYMAEVEPPSTTQPNAPTTRRTATAPPAIKGLTVNQATQQVHLTIRSLLTDEFPDLASKDAGKIEGGSKEYLNVTLNSINNFTKTMWKTWWGVVYSCMKMFVGGVCEF